MRNKELRKVDRFLAAAVPKPEILRMARAQAALRQWEEVVGPQLAERSRPDRFERGTVWVTVSGSAWAQELRMRKDLIIRRLGEISGEPDLFTQVRFGVRSLASPGKESKDEPIQNSIEDYSGLSIREIVAIRKKTWPPPP